jgi:5-methylcytosine-specific restriction protein A
MNRRSELDPLYRLARWGKLRALQLQMHPLCAFCLARGELTPADTVDHKVPHGGDIAKFWVPLDGLQSLCARCHSRRKQQIEIRGYCTDIGSDGYPIDPLHPAFTGKIPALKR